MLMYHRVIRDAYDAGADYYLYATDVDQSHSLHLVSIDYGIYSNTVMNRNQSAIQSIMQSTQNNPHLNGLTIKCIDTVPLLATTSLQDNPTQTNLSNCSLSWMVIQRMSRLANSMKKTWVRAFLRGELGDIDSSTLPSCTVVIQTGELVLLKMDHWSPVTTTTTSPQKVIKK